MQEALARIWSDLLRQTAPGAHDDFFAVGGHSLLATQLVSRIHERFGIDLPLTAVFLHPTLAGLAGRIEEAMVAEIESLSEAEARALLDRQEAGANGD